MWGRCVNDVVRKLLQFQISTNIAAAVITAVSAISSLEPTSVLSPVQLLWTNIHHGHLHCASACYRPSV